MGSWIKNGWYVAAAAKDITADALTARVILGEPVVLFRDPAGQAIALEDRCIHRAAPISLGRLTANGQRVMCPYHGLEFDITGQCVRNPHGTGQIPTGSRLHHYPVAERYGMVWLWTGDAPANIESLPDFPMLAPEDPSARSPVACVRMDVPYQLVIDNLLDLSHVSYLHDGLLGNEDTVEADTVLSHSGNAVTVERFMPNVKPPEYFDLIFLQDGQNIDLWQNITWQPPGNVLLDVGATAPGMSRMEGTGNWAGHFLTPETETSTLYHFTAVRQRPVQRSAADEARLLSRLAELRQAAFAGQDEPMIRAQYANMERAGGRFTPRLLTIDAGVVRWRRVLEDMLKNEKATAGDSVG